MLSSASQGEDGVHGNGRPTFQISLKTMLLPMVVFSVMSAGLFHASRIPAISDELNAAFGRGGTSSSTNRSGQIVFIMFTYSMPLIMAGLLNDGDGVPMVESPLVICHSRI